MIQIDFFDKDIVSTLLPISSTSPDKIIFLIDKRHINSKDPENMTRAIKGMLPETEVEFEPVTIDALEDIYSKLKEITESYSDTEELYIDLTGGTELMSACGYRIAREKEIQAIYVDVKREHVIDAETGDILSPVKHISMEDYMNAIGAKRLRDSHDLPQEDEFYRIVSMSQIIFRYTEDWQKLCQHIANTVASSGERMYVKLPSKLGKTKTGIKALVQGFQDYGFWEKVGSDNSDTELGIAGEYKFANKKAKSYMTTYGTWLELFVYIKALEIYNEAARIDPEAIKNISLNDRKRIIRILEIYKATRNDKNRTRSRI